MDILPEVRDTIARHGLLESGDTVLIALSGGPDSVTLLHVFHRLRRSFRLTLHAVYVNHGIRPRAARREEAFCAALCDRFRVPLQVVRENVPALARAAGRGLEEAAREFRYRTFEQLADRLGCTRIALGHHRDDRVETILLHLFRGAGMAGLRGMPPRRGRIVRPLFDVTRADIESYLERYRLDFCTDATNRDLRYRRNFIRHRLLPLLRERINPRVDRALIDLADIVAEEDAALARMADRTLRRCSATTPGGKIILELSLYARLDRWLRRRLWRAILSLVGGRAESPAREVIDRLDRLCLESGRAVSVPGGIRAVRSGSRVIVHPATRLRYESELPDRGRLVLDRPAVQFRVRTAERSAVIIPLQRRAGRVVMDRNKLAFPLVVRNIRPGDRFRPLGASGSRKVGDYLTDRKLPAVLRDEVPVVCDRQGIVWLVGYEIADRVKVDHTTTEVLVLERAVRKGYAAQAV